MSAREGCLLLLAAATHPFAGLRVDGAGGVGLGAWVVGGRQPRQRLSGAEARKWLP